MITLVLICYAIYTAVMYLVPLCLYCCPGKRVSHYLGDLHASGLIVGLNCRSPDQKHPVKINILLLEFFFFSSVCTPHVHLIILISALSIFVIYPHGTFLSSIQLAASDTGCIYLALHLVHLVLNYLLACLLTSFHNLLIMNSSLLFAACLATFSVAG